MFAQNETLGRLKSLTHAGQLSSMVHCPKVHRDADYVVMRLCRLLPNRLRWIAFDVVIDDFYAGAMGERSHWPVGPDLVQSPHLCSAQRRQSNEQGSRGSKGSQGCDSGSVGR